MKIACPILTVFVISSFTAVADEPIADDLTVHEWGTFTSVFASDGTMLPGLQKEDEELPEFVYAHDIPMGRIQSAMEGDGKSALRIMSKGMNRPLSNVTIKMETPVLYFYSKKPYDMSVSVGFKNGTISQWFPARSGGEILPPVFVIEKGLPVSGGIDFAKPRTGSIEWIFRTEPRDENTEFEIMKPEDTRVWMHPRAPKSNIVRTPSGEKESYLFYRGVGNFEQPIGFSVEDSTLKVKTSSEVPFLLVFRRNNDGTAEVLFRGKPGASEEIDLFANVLSSSLPSTTIVEDREVFNALRDSLVSAGLTLDEGNAMMRTWWHSYSSEVGLRAFWVVPREFTDEILPLSISPKPAKLERVLLGRSEILTPTEEDTIKAKFTNWKEGQPTPYGEHRYGGAYRALVDRSKN